MIVLPVLPTGAGAYGVPYKGVDVSSWQDDIDWIKMKSAGIDFAIIRCLAYERDRRFEEYYAGATAQGIYVGSYVYMYATTAAEAVSEATSALEVLGGRPLDFPLFLDVEDPRLEKLGKKTLTDYMLKELEMFRAAGYRVGIYTTQNFESANMDMSRLGSYDIWYAKWTKYAANQNSQPYVVEDQDPYERNPGCYIWQFSNGGDGSVYGTGSKFVDLDYCYYDYIGIGRSLFPYLSPDPDDYAVPKRNVDYAPGKATIGLDVAWVQTVLCRLGYTVEVDGSFGPASVAAVKKFQAANGIGADGIVGNTTRGKMISLWNDMKKNVLKVTFNPGNGESIATPSLYKAGDPITPPSAAEIDGHFLLGWRILRRSDMTWFTGSSFEPDYEVEPAVVSPYKAVATSSNWLSGGKTELTFFAVWREIIPGDADGDYDVTMKDVLAMRRVIAGLEDEGSLIFRLADANSDSSVDMKDVLIARRIVAGLD